ncbi:hypothetical protein DFH06DRAFT_1339218 [Mycena polygramma]|nr:hypothetical protein DFH06DRAFT_1339218 [Mycena polygramma]
MDAVVFPSGSKTECFGCAGPGSPNLMQCSNCRLARYCSSECQTADWPTHRGLCVDRETLFERYAGLGVPVDVLRFLKWMDYWRLSVLRWALYSSDIAHQPVDFLVHNCFVLLLEVRPPGSYLSVKSTYSAVEHGMRGDAEIIDRLRVFPVIGHRDRLISDFRLATPTTTKWATKWSTALGFPISFTNVFPLDFSCAPLTFVLHLFALSFYLPFNIRLCRCTTCYSCTSAQRPSR